MNGNTLQTLFVDQLQDIYDAEQQLVKALPKLADAAESPDLAEAIRTHLQETQSHVSRLEEVFGMIGEKAKGKTCKGMKGLIAEGDESAAEGEGDLRDLAIIAGAQRVEHYEIAAYGTARTLAERLDLDDAAQLLRQTEDEEEQADAKLSDLADSIYDALEDEIVDDEAATPKASRSGGRS